jgi:hypothetical protein
MGIEEVLTAPRSPWQNPYAERIIGSMRRECLDFTIIFNDDALALRVVLLFSILSPEQNASLAQQGLF